MPWVERLLNNRFKLDWIFVVIELLVFLNLLTQIHIFFQLNREIFLERFTAFKNWKMKILVPKQNWNALVNTPGKRVFILPRGNVYFNISRTTTV